MTVEQTRAYLRQVKEQKDDVNRLIDKLISLRARLTSIKTILPDPNKVQSSPRNALEELYADIDEEERRLITLITAEKTLINEVERSILQVQNTAAKKVLLWHYIECKPYGEVAKIVAYSESYVRELSHKGVEELAKIL